MRPPRGLYAITDATLLPEDCLLAGVGQALAGGAALIQYRDKNDNQGRRLHQAQALQALCARHQVPLVINDDIGLAATVGAAGVHLGKEDDAVAEARKQLGPDAIIGVSCYNRLELAVEAAAAGADYVAFGRFFASSTKPDAVQADVQLLARAREQLEIPICAIGGIDATNGASLVAAGADLLAVVQGVFGREDIRAAAATFSPLFGEHGVG